MSQRSMLTQVDPWRFLDVFGIHLGYQMVPYCWQVIPEGTLPVFQVFPAAQELLTTHLALALGNPGGYTLSIAIYS